MFGLKPSSAEGVKSVDKISTLCFMSILYCTTSQNGDSFIHILVHHLKMDGPPGWLSTQKSGGITSSFRNCWKGKVPTLSLIKSSEAVNINFSFV